MQPFKITCVTCRARLSVRNASLIGQIIACPKCGSMVQVAAPTGTSVGDSSASGIVLAAVVPIAAIATPTQQPPEQPSTTYDDFAAASDEVEAAEIAPWPPLAPTAPPTTVASEVGRWSATKLTAAAAVSALAGAALVATLFSMLRDEPVAQVLPANVAAVQPDESEAEPSAEVVADAPVEPLPSEPVAEVAAEPSPDPAATAPPTDDNPFAPSTASGDPAIAVDEANATAPPPVPTPPGTEPETPTSSVASAAAPPAAEARPRIVIDPLAVDPEGLDLSTLLRGPATDPLAASDLPPEPAEPVESAVPAADAPVDDVPPADHRFEPVGPPADVAALLARRVPAVAIDEMPLCRFVDFASEFSGLPVSVSPEELRLAAVSAATPVKVDAKNATIEELLTALKPLRLAPTVEGPQVILRRIVDDKRRELAYPVDDLARGELEMQRLAGWVQDLAAPETWTAHGGDGTLAVDGSSLRINARERTGYEAILFLERYRMARGLRPRSKYPASLLATGAATGVLAERMQAPATFTFSQSTPLRAVVRWWQEETQTAILVDWPALADERSWPQSRITASATSKPWGEAIAATLAPLGLGWRPVDERTIEITTLAKILSDPQLELYRLEPVTTAKAEDLLAQVDRLSSGDSPPASDGAAFYDADQRVLMVRQPAAAQRRLVEWLAGEGLIVRAGADAAAAD